MDTKKTTEALIKNIKKYFDDNGRKTAVVGISGGKDSLVTAMLLKEAIGEDNVVGVLLPDGVQEDIVDANTVTGLLNIKQSSFNILPITANFIEIAFSIMNKQGNLETVPVTEQSKINLRPRIRTAMLYYIAQSLDNACVVGTSNAAELFVGYNTKGDNGDVMPLGELYVDEVLKIGENLISKNFKSEDHEAATLMRILNKTPSDGICGLSDEDAIGVSYADIKTYATKGTTKKKGLDNKIKTLHDNTNHKRQVAPTISLE